MFFGKYVKKTDIRFQIKREVRNAEKKLETRLKKEYANIVEDIRKEQEFSENILKKAIKEMQKQHSRDLRARNLLNSNREFFQRFKEKTAPHLLDTIKDLGKLMSEFDRGEVRDNDAARKDPKVLELYRKFKM